MINVTVFMENSSKPIRIEDTDNIEESCGSLLVEKCGKSWCFPFCKMYLYKIEDTDEMEQIDELDDILKLK